MRGFVDLLKRFHSDERGVFAVIFGVMAIVLVAFGGAAVDYTAVETARTRAQVALDSAALGLQPTIFDDPAPTEEELKADALALLNERLDDNTLVTDVEIATATPGEGTLHLEATVTVRTAFVSLVGVPSLTARIVSEATRKRLNLEVAMVLDNSGSMQWYNRMPNLIKAAKCAANVLLNALDECTDEKIEASDGEETTEENIWIGIVPFTGFVNVGNGNRNATWMDTTGLSSIANDNFDDDDIDATPFTGTVNRFTLFDNIGVGWRGCVEARPYPYDTNDTEPTAADPDTLFIPQFAPDNPDSGYSNSFIPDAPNACTRKAPKYIWTQTKTGCNDAGTTRTKYNNAYCTGATTNAYEQVSELSVTTTATSTAPAEIYYNPYPGANAYSDSYSSTGSGSNRTNRRVRTWTYQFSDRELQERLCKYTGTTGWGSSPNDDCPTNALTPLTSTKSTIINAIEAMYPQGFTNIHQGTIWGYHMLTPTAPLAARAFEGSTSKVLIIMTDGENTVDNYGANTINKANTYQAYGWPGAAPYNGRIYSTDYPTPSSGAEVTASMDSRALESCTNAKAANIAIYTIGLNPPTQRTIDLLTNCATDPSMAYFPVDASELTDIFKEIADELANLRLSL